MSHNKTNNFESNTKSINYQYFLIKFQWEAFTNLILNAGKISEHLFAFYFLKNFTNHILVIMLLSFKQVQVDTMASIFLAGLRSCEVPDHLLKPSLRNKKKSFSKLCTNPNIVHVIHLFTNESALKLHKKTKCLHYLHLASKNIRKIWKDYIHDG